MDRRDGIISSCQQVTFKLHSAGRCRLALHGCVHFENAIFKISVVFLDLLLFLRISSDKYKTCPYQRRPTQECKCHLKVPALPVRLCRQVWCHFQRLPIVFVCAELFLFRKVGSFRYRSLGSARLPWNALQPKWAATELNWSPHI